MTGLQISVFKSVATVVVAGDLLNDKYIEELEKTLEGQNITVVHRNPNDLKPRTDEELCKMIQADHLLSDAVCFIGNDLSEVVDPYLDWISACGGDFAVERNKPFAYAYVTHSYTDRQHARDEFLYECLGNQKASNRSKSELVDDAFQDLEIFGPFKPLEFEAT
jgi:hypothetical protein